MAGTGLLGRVRAARFPFAAPSWPTTVERPDPERKVGLDYDHEWSRRYPVRLARAVVMDNVTRPAARLLAPATVRGLEHLQHIDGPVIFAANHASHIDTPLLLTTLPVEFRHRTVVAAASDYFFDRTWKSVLWSFALAAIPIERSKVNRKSADTAAELIEDGWNLVIFPEGGRSPDGWTQPFRGGAAYLARRTGRPVVPVYLHGTRHVLPKIGGVGDAGARGVGHRVAAGRPAAPLPHRRPVRRAHDARRRRERASLLGPGRGGSRHAVARGPLGLVAGPPLGQRSCAGRGRRARPPRPRGLGLAPGLGPRRAAGPPGRHGVARLSVRIERLGSFSLGWGESLVWDDRAERLFFVDCAAQTLHWLDGGRPPLHTMRLPSMAAGIVLTEEGTLVGALDDGLHVLDAAAGTTSLLTAYPPGLGARANDACADFAGNLVTGTLNMGPAEGSSWWYSARDGWRLLDPAISNTNGPNAYEDGGAPRLVIGDTSGDYYSYPYDAVNGTVGERSVFGDVSGLDGVPDGAAFDADGGLWCALVGGAQLARFTTHGLEQTVALPVGNPADVAFGGADLDRLFVASIGMSSDEESLDGALLVVDGLGVRGRVRSRGSRWGRRRRQSGSNDRVTRMTTSAKPASRCTNESW